MTYNGDLPRPQGGSSNMQHEGLPVMARYCAYMTLLDSRDVN